MSTKVDGGMDIGGLSRNLHQRRRNDAMSGKQEKLTVSIADELDKQMRRRGVDNAGWQKVIRNQTLADQIALLIEEKPATAKEATPKGERDVPTDTIPEGPRAIYRWEDFLSRWNQVETIPEAFGLLDAVGNPSRSSSEPSIPWNEPKTADYEKRIRFLIEVAGKTPTLIPRPPSLPIKRKTFAVLCEQFLDMGHARRSRKIRRCVSQDLWEKVLNFLVSWKKQMDVDIIKERTICVFLETIYVVSCLKESDIEAQRSKYGVLIYRPLDQKLLGLDDFLFLNTMLRKIRWLIEDALRAYQLDPEQILIDNKLN